MVLNKAYKKEIKEIDDEVIYLINDEVKFKKIGVFKENEEKTTKTKSYKSDYSSFGGSWENGNRAYDDINGYVGEEQEILDSEIDKIFLDCLGYIPFYIYDMTNQTINLNEETKLLMDLSVFLDESEYSIKNKEILIPIETFDSLRIPTPLNKL